MSKFLIRESAAAMPTSVQSPYVHIAVLEVEDDVESPPIISERARGVIRIVQVWRKLPRRGTTLKSAYGRARAEAEALITQLQREQLEEEEI